MTSQILETQRGGNRASALPLADHGGGVSLGGLQPASAHASQTYTNTYQGTSQLRGWVYTLNNWTEEEYKILKDTPCRYHIMAKEIGLLKGTPHIQGYIEFENRGKRLTGVRKLAKRASWYARLGTPMEASNYCKKTPEFIEMGTLPSQGARNDLAGLRDRIVKGTSVDVIMMECPEMFHQYGRTLQKIEDLQLRKKYRKEMTKGIWFYGKTGVGKSHKAFENFSPDTHYVFPNDNGWWDGYTQQETVIINEFRGSVSYGFLLQLVDKWPISVKRRNREPMPFTSNTLIITSSLAPQDVFFNLSEKDSMEQLYRRFEVFEMLESGEIIRHVESSKPQQIFNYVQSINQHNI